MILTSLTTGCLADIIGGLECSKPVLQVLGIRRISGDEGNVRVRLLLSDGQNLTSYAMLAAHTNIDENILTTYAIIRIEKHSVMVLNEEKRLVIISDLTVLHPGAEVKKKIGDPQPFFVPRM